MSTEMFVDERRASEMGAAAGRALLHRDAAMTAPAIDLARVRRGARRRVARRRTALATGCIALVAAAGLVVRERREPPSNAEQPAVDVPTPLVGAVAVLPERYGDPTSMYSARAGTPRGVESPQVDVWQSGDRRIVVRTFGLIDESPDTVPVSTPPSQQRVDLATPQIERLADDQWLFRMTSDRFLGTNVVVRGMSKDEATAAVSDLTLVDGVLTPSGYRLVEHQAPTSAQEPVQWYVMLGYDTPDGLVYVTTNGSGPGSATIELAGTWSAAALETVDGRETLVETGEDGSFDTVSFLEPGGALVSVRGSGVIKLEALAREARFIDQRQLVELGDRMSASRTQLPQIAAASVDGLDLVARGTTDDPIVCIADGDSTTCAGRDNPDGPPFSIMGSTEIDGEWIVFGVRELLADEHIDPDTMKFTTPEGGRLPVTWIEKDGRGWYVTRIPDGVNVVAIDSQDVGGLIGWAARPIVTDSIA